MSLFVDQDDIARAVDAIANPKDTLVGEGKKFKTEDDLARGKLYSDLFIDKLKIEQAEIQRRNQELQTELEKLRNAGKGALEVINRETNTNSDDNGIAPKMFTQDDVKKIVQDTLLHDREVSTRKGNVDHVTAELQKTWGTDAMTKLEEAANLYGGKEEVQRMAETNPKALLKLIGTKEPVAQTEHRNSSIFSPPVSTVRPPTGNTGVVKGAKYYDNLRKENPNKYWSAESMNQRLNDMIALGDNYSKH